MAVVLFAVAGAAWADHHNTPPGPPLRITDVSPDGGTTGVSTTPTITIIFDKQMEFDTLNDNVKLKKAGSRKAIGFLTSISTFVPEGHKYERDTIKALKPNTTYKVIVDGGLDGVRSLEAGKLGGVDDSSATFRNGNVVWTFKTAP